MTMTHEHPTYRESLQALRSAQKPPRGVSLYSIYVNRPVGRRIAAALGGAMLLKRAITGHCEVKQKLGIGENPAQSAARRRRPRRKDPVLEASEDSFPASDPPAWTPVAGSVARD